MLEDGSHSVTLVVRIDGASAEAGAEVAAAGVEVAAAGVEAAAAGVSAPLRFAGNSAQGTKIQPLSTGGSTAVSV